MADKTIEQLSGAAMNTSLETIQKGVVVLMKGIEDRDRIIKELRMEISRLRKMLEEKTAQLRGLRGEDI